MLGFLRTGCPKDCVMKANRKTTSNEILMFNFNQLNILPVLLYKRIMASICSDYNANGEN